MSMEKERERMEDYSLSWLIICWYTNVYFASFYGLYLAIFEVKWMTVVFAMFLTMISFIGINIGAHRYYAHRTFKASKSLEIFFVVAHTLAGVGSIYKWVLLHRMHHKYYRTDKDPYNHEKGFIYSHFMSNLTNKFLEDKNLVKSIDMRDIDGDVYIWLQKSFYFILFLFISLFFPIYIPIAYWNESIVNSFFVVGFLRWMITSNMSWLVNSAFLVWGLKSTDKYPVDDNSVFFIEKTFWPNYHYLFPRDWKSSEYGHYNTGFGTLLIKFFYELGLVNTLITTSTEDVREALYKIASESMSVKESLKELERLSEEKAINNNLCYYQ